jgi:hypothetical protein
VQGRRSYSRRLETLEEQTEGAAIQQGALARSLGHANQNANKWERDGGSCFRLGCGTGLFLTCHQLCSYSRTFNHFMELQISSLCSQQPHTGDPILKVTNPVYTTPSYLTRNHFNIIRLGLSSDYFLVVFLSTSYTHSSPFVRNALPTSSSPT